MILFKGNIISQDYELFMYLGRGMLGMDCKSERSGFNVFHGL